MSVLAFVLTLFAVLPLWAYLPNVHQKLVRESHLDSEMAEIGESLSAKINGVLGIERSLAQLRWQCAHLALHPGALLALQVAARALLMRESFLLTALQIETTQLARRGLSLYRSPPRDPGVACGVPGALRWPPSPENIFSLRMHRGGVDILLADTEVVRWLYAHSGVGPL